MSFSACCLARTLREAKHSSGVWARHAGHRAGSATSSWTRGSHSMKQEGTRTPFWRRPRAFWRRKEKRPAAQACPSRRRKFTPPELASFLSLRSLPNSNELNREKVWLSPGREPRPRGRPPGNLPEEVIPRRGKPPGKIELAVAEVFDQREDEQEQRVARETVTREKSLVNQDRHQGKNDTEEKGEGHVQDKCLEAEHAQEISERKQDQA